MTKVAREGRISIAAPPEGTSVLATRRGQLTVALPSIRRDPRLSVQSLKWVESGYLLTYGGFGRRLVRVAGAVLLGVSGFAASSLWRLVHVVCLIAAPAGSPRGRGSPLFESEASFDDSECLVEQRLQRPNVSLGVPDARGCGQGPDQRRGDHLDLELARISSRGARQHIGDELAKLVDLPRRRGLQVGVIEGVAELATGEFFVTAEEGRHHRGERPPHRLHRRVRDELRLDGVDQPEIELVVKDDPFLGAEVAVDRTRRYLRRLSDLFDRHALEATLVEQIERRLLNPTDRSGSLACPKAFPYLGHGPIVSALDSNSQSIVAV
jgi:hypothetical protein